MRDHISCSDMLDVLLAKFSGVIVQSPSFKRIFQQSEFRYNFFIYFCKLRLNAKFN